MSKPLSRDGSSMYNGILILRGSKATGMILQVKAKRTKPLQRRPISLDVDGDTTTTTAPFEDRCNSESNGLERSGSDGTDTSVQMVVVARSKAGTRARHENDLDCSKPMRFRRHVETHTPLLCPRPPYISLWLRSVVFIRSFDRSF